MELVRQVVLYFHKDSVPENFHLVFVVADSFVGLRLVCKRRSVVGWGLPFAVDAAANEASRWLVVDLRPSKYSQVGGTRQTHGSSWLFVYRRSANAPRRL